MKPWDHTVRKVHSLPKLTVWGKFIGALVRSVLVLPLGSVQLHTEAVT